MPRTQITFPKVPAELLAPVQADEYVVPASEQPPNGGRSVGESALHVTWSPADRGAHVQVALEIPLGYAAMVLDSPNGNSPDTTFVYSPPLDRATINTLIKALKRARTSAYGE